MPPDQNINGPKYLLHVRYACCVQIPTGGLLGPADEWVIYKGRRVPEVGETGFGRTCRSYVSLQACEDTDCYAEGGIIDKIEPYSIERARELGLETQ